MSSTEPIRNSNELKNFIDYYKQEELNPRNFCLIVAGLNTALRIGDLLKLTWDDVFNFAENSFRSHLIVKESKTDKFQSIAINKELLDALLSLKIYLKKIEPCQYLFESNKSNSPISRIQAYRIIKKAAVMTLADSSHISCHSLRKTFGYFAYKKGTNPALLMSIYNHSSFEITKRYLGINQDEKDSVFLSLHF